MMDNEPFDGFAENALTDEERAIIAAFDAVDLDAGSVGTDLSYPSQTIVETAGALNRPLHEDMQAIFVEEVAIDCITLEQVLERRPVSERSPGDATQAQIIQRIAHKLKGTCGAMHCDVLAALALHMETLTKLIEQNAIAPQMGWQAMEYASHALQETLEDFAAAGQENPAFLATFETSCHTLGVELHADGRDQAGDAINRFPTGQPFAPAPFVRADVQRVDKLLEHTEQLTALETALVQAQGEVESAFQELHAAEERLHRLEIRLTNHLTLKGRDAGQEDDAEHSTSTLVERILGEATRRTGRLVPRRALFQAREIGALNLAPTDWDELEMDRFKEESVLALSLSEAIADVSIAASQLRMAFAQLTRLLREQAAQVTLVRNDSLLLSLTPLDMLLKRIEQEVARENRNQIAPIQCEVTGETTEIDQEMVDQLAPILLQLIRVSLATYVPLPSNATAESSRMWLHVRAVGSAVSIEVGFSMDVAGGAFEEVASGIRALGGEIEPRRNALGGINYHLRLPRSSGTVHAVILRERGHSFAVPLSQIERAALAVEEEETVAPLVALRELLGLSLEADSLSGRERSSRPAIYLTLASDEQEEEAPAGGDRSPAQRPRIQVDEVVGDAALIVKPLPPHLQRPGIAGAAIDGANNVLLLLDLLGLLRRYDGRSQSRAGHIPSHYYYPFPEGVASPEGAARPAWDAERLPAPTDRIGDSLCSLPVQAQPRPRTAIVADDSVSIRQSLHQSLMHANYQVFDARDGIQALELLQLHVPDALILDVEMPNLNGYDVLSRMHSYPELASVKIVMLTSRFTEKHQARAKELGAHAYLTKPCDPETLLGTLEHLLGAGHISSHYYLSPREAARPAWGAERLHFPTI
ncbi:MAG TPA: response regulator [Ktedonobacteraceae bacterium]|nr:response regulator [Ktedonobacteraceae bacterium]